MNFVSSNWKKLSEKILVDNIHVGKLTEEDVLLPDGKTATYYVQRKEPYSIIIPFEDNMLHMVRQYRYSVATLSLEFPMGNVEEKDPLDTAKKELKEELGMTAGIYKELGHFWNSPGRSSQVGYIYLATELTKGEKEPDEGEFLQSESYAIKDVKKMIDDGTIKDGSTIVAFHYFETYLANL